MNGTRQREDPTLEIELTLDMARVVLLAALLILLLVAAFAWGRASVNPALSTATRPTNSAPAELSTNSSVFDRVEQSAARQQVEAERSGTIELDLGTVGSRDEAEARRKAALAQGISASIVSVPGGFRIAAGPFKTRAEAEAAAKRLTIYHPQIVGQ